MDAHELQALWDKAAKHQARNENRTAVEVYERFLAAALDPNSELPEKGQLVAAKSGALNLAQVLTKLGEYERALRFIAQALALQPSPFGRAVALAAKGEALCGLRRHQEGLAAFEDAAKAHPVVGRLNSADSMTRTNSPELWNLAATWVDTVVSQYADQLSDDLKSEVQTIRAAIPARQHGYDSMAVPATESASPSPSTPRYEDLDRTVLDLLEATAYSANSDRWTVTSRFVKAHSIQDALTEAATHVPPDHLCAYRNTLRNVPRSETKTASASTIEEALKTVMAQVDPSASVIDKSVREPDLIRRKVRSRSADDARRTLVLEYGTDAQVLAVELAEAGKPGFLGLKRMDPVFDCEIRLTAVVTVTLRTPIEIEVEVQLLPERGFCQNCGAPRATLKSYNRLVWCPTGFTKEVAHTCVGLPALALGPFAGYELAAQKTLGAYLCDKCGDADKLWKLELIWWSQIVKDLELAETPVILQAKVRSPSAPLLDAKEKLEETKRKLAYTSDETWHCWLCGKAADLCGRGLSAALFGGHARTARNFKAIWLDDSSIRMLRQEVT